MTTMAIVTLDNREPRRIVLEPGGEVWAGRDPSCQLHLDTLSVSRRHVAVEWENPGFKVTDSSSNGTLVNGLLLKGESRVFALNEIVLQVGQHHVRVQRVVQALRDETSHDSPVEPQSERSKTEGVEFSADERRRIRRQLLDHLDLTKLDRAELESSAMREKVILALRRILSEHEAFALKGLSLESVIRDLTDEVLGLGPLERLLADDTISEIMVVDAHTIFVEKKGRLEQVPLSFTDDDSVRAVIERIVTPLGRRIDESTPLVDARLRDGSRVNAVIPPLALKGPCITIRRFSKNRLLMKDLVAFSSISEEMAAFLTCAVKVRKNVVISGGTGSGKTTLLNVLSSAIPEHERIVTVEDAAELRLNQPHVVSLESRPANLEGKGEYSIRDLVKNALRMRPDRIVVGECRGGEAIDMLQAMNTGHEGSLTTTHANSPKEAISRLETLCLMGGLDLPVRAIRQQIAASIHLVVQQSRFSDGARRVTSIAEVAGVNDDGEIDVREIYGFRLTEVTNDGKTRGRFAATGSLPSFLDDFMTHGFWSERGLRCQT
jgi:pilus assembly protein CpaF